jgi:hypothetical protein
MKFVVTFFVILLAALLFFTAAALLYEGWLMIKRLFKGQKQEDIRLFSWFNPFHRD